MCFLVGVSLSVISFSCFIMSYLLVLFQVFRIIYLCKLISLMRFYVHPVVIINKMVFWNMMLHSLAERCNE